MISSKDNLIKSGDEKAPRPQQTWGQSKLHRQLTLTEGTHNHTGNLARSPPQENKGHAGAGGTSNDVDDVGRVKSVSNSGPDRLKGVPGHGSSRGQSRRRLYPPLL